MSFIQHFQNITGNNPLTRRRALVGLSLLTLTACSRSTIKTDSAAKDVAYYTCTMHPFVRSKDPNGKCPVCGMNLVAVLAQSQATNSPVEARIVGSAHIAPERLQEIGATTEQVTKQPWSGQQVCLSSRAVLPTGNKFIVFVDQGNGQVEPREVTLGRETDRYYEALSGVQEGDHVFVSANFLIDAECRIQGALKTWGDRP